MRRAVVDIGTNSVKLLVAEVVGDTVVPLIERSEQTRLGSGLFAASRLEASAISRTVAAVTRFVQETEQLGPATLRIIATSAAREASNQEELVAALRRATGLDPVILSGEQEADWVFAGVSADARFQSMPLLILDVGGGSTEFVLGRSGAQWFGKSLRLGTVRLLEERKLSDPPAAAQWTGLASHLERFLLVELAHPLDGVLQGRSTAGLQLVGTGGTATILARLQLGLNSFDREKIEAARIGLEDLRGIRSTLWSLPLEARRKLPGLPPNRADVILTGVAIYETVMKLLGFSELHISTRGLRFAAVLAAPARTVPPKQDKPVPASFPTPRSL